MSEMVEKCAQRLYEADASYIAQGGWPDVPEHKKALYRRQARVAIEAMREPTEAMVAAGSEACERSRGAAHAGWELMIDAALNETADA